MSASAFTTQRALFVRHQFLTCAAVAANPRGRRPSCSTVTVTLSLQDVVNVVGGVGVLLPLLEQICEVEPVLNGGQEISDLLGPELTSSRGPTAMLLPLNKSSGEDRLSNSHLVGAAGAAFRNAAPPRRCHFPKCFSHVQTLTQPMCCFFFLVEEMNQSCRAACDATISRKWQSVKEKPHYKEMVLQRPEIE